MAVIVARWTDVVFTVRSANVVQETGASPRSRLQAHVVRQEVAIYCTVTHIHNKNRQDVKYDKFKR